MDTRPFYRRASRAAAALVSTASLALATSASLASCSSLALPSACEPPMPNPPRHPSFDRWILPEPAAVRRDVARPAPDEDPVLEALLRSFDQFEPARRFAGAVDFKENDPAERARDGRIDRSRQIPPPVGGGGDALLSLFAMAAQGWTAHNQAPR